MPKKILSCSNLSLLYPKPPAKPLLHSISFEMFMGEIVCVLGPNGSGKSTLLKTILGHFAYSGEMVLNGINAKTLSVSARAKILSYVPQNYILNFPYSVLEVVLMGRFNHSRFIYSKSDRQKALDALQSLGIEHLANHAFPTLSGGQKQLVLIARALAQESEMILLDEMTSALDLSHCFSLLETLKGLKKSLILTSHHPDQCFIADKIAMIKNATLLCYGSPKEVLCESRIEQLYGVATQSVPLPNGGVYFCVKSR